ncbi:MAG TPA: hypothetical protein VEC99_12320 [Clostridia bacterium]|nr:hypothetical protein [Clostridia bacterium]
MKLSQPSHFSDPYLVYDPIGKHALVVDYDELITLPGPFATYSEAKEAMSRLLDDKPRRVASA